MLDLTFGEQVKIVLGRRGMTIKDLAEEIEERTGKKMSRQNLTQRLGRDNFQEQDMRMIAGILGCPFRLDILGEEASPSAELSVGREAFVEEPAQEEPLAAEEEEEDLVKGDVNPYTGREYKSNSVRMHPKRIGYVQVYDRGEHKWTDMTEWAFLGYQERKKALLGKDYEPPIYLD